MCKTTKKGAVCPLAARRLSPEDIFEQMKREAGDDTA